MADEGYSTYQWETSSLGNDIKYNAEKINDNIKVTATITKKNIFALIVGKYQVTVSGTYNMNDGVNNQEEKRFTATCTCMIDTHPKLCTKENDSYKIDLILNLEDDIEYEDSSNKPDKDSEIKYTYTDFKVQEGSGGAFLNDYLYILKMPKLISPIRIVDSNKSIENKYVEGSAIPINEIENISTIDFHNIRINSDDGLDIFHKLAYENDIGVTIETNALDTPELTVVDLPDSGNETIYICKSKSKNNGITFKISDPDESLKHFGYIIHIGSDKSAGYNSVWINRNMLNVIFPGMPADIMSTTEKFEYKGGFKLNKLTYKEIDVVAPNSINNVEFSNDDKSRLESEDYAPTYKAVTINESQDGDRANNMLLKNIEFVKFGDRVIKLNYEPLSEAQNQSI